METVNGRLRLVAARLAFAFGVVAFALGSIGPFLALDWPPLLGEMVFGYLVAFLATRVAITVGHFLLSPEAERFTIIPMNTVAARFWCRRLSVFVGWFAFGWVTVGLLSTFGFSLEGRQLVAYALGLGLLAIALESVWRRPAALNDGPEAPHPKRPAGPRRAERDIVGRDRAAVGVLGGKSHARLLVHCGHYYPAARHQHYPACGRTSASTARHGRDCRGSAQRRRGLLGARASSAVDHRRRCGARLGLGHRPRQYRRARELVRAGRPQCAKRGRHPARCGRRLADDEDRDRSQACRDC